MGILSDRQIEKEVGIEPFDDGRRKEGRISSGVGSYGYDLRIGYRFKVLKSTHCPVLDPKNFPLDSFDEIDLTPGPGPGGAKPDHILIPPHAFVLGESVEVFRIPRGVLCVVIGKSTYCRCGLVVNVSPGEPEWTGRWTIELSNTTPLPIKVYCNEGIAQAVFHRSDEQGAVVADWFRTGSANSEGEFRKAFAAASCRTSYADKKGRYQNQSGVTLPTADGTVPAEIKPVSPPPPPPRPFNLPPLPCPPEYLDGGRAWVAPDRSASWRWSPRQSRWVCVAKEGGK